MTRWSLFLQTLSLTPLPGTLLQRVVAHNAHIDAVAENQSGKFSRLPDRSLRYALAGSVLMDLTLEGRIDTDPGRVILVDSTPTGDDLLDPILADIVNGGYHNVHYRLTHADVRVWQSRTRLWPGWFLATSWTGAGMIITGSSLNSDTVAVPFSAVLHQPRVAIQTT